MGGEWLHETEFLYACRRDDVQDFVAPWQRVEKFKFLYACRRDDVQDPRVLPLRLPPGRFYPPVGVTTFRTLLLLLFGTNNWFTFLYACRRDDVQDWPI